MSIQPDLLMENVHLLEGKGNVIPEVLKKTVVTNDIAEEDLQTSIMKDVNEDNTCDEAPTNSKRRRR